MIELLVVVSIIVLLASLTLSAIGIVRESAHGSACASNMRQFGVILHIYVSDNDGLVPPVYPPLPERSSLVRITNGTWIDCMYISDPDCVQKGLFACPAWQPRSDITQFNRYAGSYAPNKQLLEQLFPSATGKQFNYALSRIKKSSSKIWLAEVMGIDSSGSYVPGYETDPPRAVPGGFSNPATVTSRTLPTGTNFASLRLRHRGRFNALFYDGHVESLRVADLYLANSFNYWNTSP